MARQRSQIVICDASPLIGLAIVGGLSWLPKLFGEVCIPVSVRDEVLPGVEARGEAEIVAAIASKLLRVWTQPIPRPKPPLADLDAGETDCISLALSLAPARALLLMDERAGRAMASERGIAVAGTAAIIGLAKKRRLIRAAKPRFATLHATDFRMSANVIETILRDVGEL